MRKIGVQFHVTIQEIVSFLNEIVRGNALKCYGYNFFSEPKVMEITTFSQEEIKKYDEVRISRTGKDLSNSEEGLGSRDGDLVIHLGKDDGQELVESAMGVVTEAEIDLLWEKIINRFKRKLLKGAYVVTPSGMKKYYPNLRYSVGAKEAYEKGVIIKPIAGWNHYELREPE